MKEVEELELVKSPLTIAILNKNKLIVKQLLEDSNYNLIGDVNPQTGDTCIHIACKNSSDILILESLLLKLRNQLAGDKTAISEFLALTNSDGMKALDYCVFKNRNDMAVVLQEFVNSSQQIIDIKSYELESNYRTDARNI